MENVEQSSAFKKLLIVVAATALVGGGGYWVYRSASVPEEEVAKEVFGEEYCHEMGLTEAQEIAINSECGNQLEGSSMCNEDTKTWWLDLDIEKEGCNPACVVNVETRQAEINWRCTGLIPD